MGRLQETGWDGTQGDKGTGRAGCACHGSGGLVRPSHCACYRLEGKPEAMPLCLCGAGTIGGVAFPGAPWGAQGQPDLPPHTLRGAWEGGEPGWVGAAGRATQAGVRHGGLCHCPCSSSAAARVPVQSLPGVLGLASAGPGARDGCGPVSWVGFAMPRAGYQPVWPSGRP